MKTAIWSIAVLLALGACGSKAPVNGGDSEDSDEQWVCQPDDDSWNCDQGDEPGPSQPPEAALPDAATEDPADPLDPDQLPGSDETQPSAETAQSSTSADGQSDTDPAEGDEIADTASQSLPESGDDMDASATPDEEPDLLGTYDHLRIMDLPREHWTVQLVALKQEANLARHAEKLGLGSLPSARIANGGELYHVLLLGFYPSRASAEQAVAQATAPIDGQKVYFRSVGSLHNAIKAGDELALAGS